MHRLKLFFGIVFCAFVLGPMEAFGQAPAFTDQEIRPDSVNDVAYNRLPDRVHEILTTGSDPYLSLKPLTFSLPPEHRAFSFEYFCPKGLDHLQIWFAPPFSNERSRTVNTINPSEGWILFSIDLSEDLKGWGKPGDFLRLDFGSRNDVRLQLRNLRLRPLSEQERQIAAGREEKKARDLRFHENLENYLATDFPSRIESVIVAEKTIRITGRVEGSLTVSLCETPPYDDVTEERSIVDRRILPEGQFDVEYPRYVSRDGFLYDRLLSKWALVDADRRLISHGRYADEIPARLDLPEEKPSGRKGLGGFSARRGHLEDLEDLGIRSATVNVWFPPMMRSQPGANRIEHVYNGRSWYFDQDAISNLDATLRETARRNIIVAAILLVSRAEHCPDPEIGRLFQHPDMDPSGIYSMPNMTTPESVNTYAAALDFLASRYSRPDKAYGRIHHWILHNEVDAGWVWTNMGEKTSLVFMDAYIKSMRMCYQIARSHNPHSEVFISLTHHWAWTSDPRFYRSKELLDILIDYTRREGDFEWALAYHPYPESLYEPKTWLDQKTEFTFETPLITFRNLEVLDQWIKRPEVLFQGRKKRTLWLSENGTNSKTYSEKDLEEQAAGFAYAWKKMKHLDGIDGFQWHNWYDHRGEGGLRIGLRRFPDDKENPGAPKPVWHVYQAADTMREDEIFGPYLKTIGITSWDEIRHKGPIPMERCD